VRPDYDAWHQSVSALSLGPAGWVQAVNFAFFGGILLGTAPAWRRVLSGGRGETAYPALTAVVGLSFTVLAFLPQDPAPGYDPERLGLDVPTVIGLLHLAIAGVAAGCSVAGLLVLASRFARDKHWHAWTVYTRVMAGLMVACIAVYGVWSTQASGLAGTFERLALIIPSIWGFSFLQRLSARTPFMVISREVAYPAPDSLEVESAR
jgi:hypothetical protein